MGCITWEKGFQSSLTFFTFFLLIINETVYFFLLLRRLITENVQWKKLSKKILKKFSFHHGLL